MPDPTRRRFPATRLRRRRASAFMRELTREHELQASDLILPVFVVEPELADADGYQPVASMPGVRRMTIERLLGHAREWVDTGLPAVALFPNIDASLRSPRGDAALDPDGLIPRAVRALKADHPGLGIITDAALDPYTSHGQDGVVDAQGRILNDETTTLLCQQALVCADAGSDVIAPSDMMDGRIGAIREALETAGHQDVSILSYAAKYASDFYGPFRDAVGSSATLGLADKRTYQMDPGNGREALDEVGMDIAEGADVVMVKPGLPYLDVVRQVKDTFGLPTFVYQVSGEYSMLRGAIDAGWLKPGVVTESLLCCKRAGADAILSYFAADVARALAD